MHYSFTVEGNLAADPELQYTQALVPAGFA
jgi:hypothetical protein